MQNFIREVMISGYLRNIVIATWNDPSSFKFS